MCCESMHEKSGVAEDASNMQNDVLRDHHRRSNPLEKMNHKNIKEV